MINSKMTIAIIPRQSSTLQRVLDHLFRIYLQRSQQQKAPFIRTTQLHKHTPSPAMCAAFNSGVYGVERYLTVQLRVYGKFPPA